MCIIQFSKSRELEILEKYFIYFEGKKREREKETFLYSPSDMSFQCLFVNSLNQNAHQPL